MTTYRFWNGLDTIGGNIVEVRTEKARVICDFGLSVRDRMMEQPAGMSELEYLLLEKQLPAISGLYDTTSFQTLELETAGENPIETAIFVSHLHLDHMGGLQYLPEGTVVYLSRESYELYQILLDVKEEKPVQVEFRPMDYGEDVQIGDIKVTAKHTDHDAAGSVAFFIETEDLKLIHSGDVRLSGNHPERVERWTKEAAEWEPDVLLLEGTSYSFEDREVSEEDFGEEFNETKDVRPASEKELLEKAADLLQSNPTQVLFFNPYIRNVERMKDVSDVVEAEGRKMVFEETYARVLHAVYPNGTWNVLEETITKKDAPYIRERVSLSDIVEAPGQFVLQNSFKHIDFTAQFEEGIYAHSNGEPLGDYDARYAVMLDILLKNKFIFVELGASGHAEKQELLDIAKTVSATLTVPWHTFRPDVYMDALLAYGLESFLPQKDILYTK